MSVSELYQAGPIAIDGPVQVRALYPDAGAKLSTMGAFSSLADGKINLLSLDPIVERLGGRWPAKRESVYQYTERNLEKHVGENGYFLRVSETDFLVALPDEGKFAAQLRCLHCLRGILTYFLGEARPADMTVLAVDEIHDDTLRAQLVDPVAVALAADREMQQAEAAADSGPLDRWTPFIAANGAWVRVSCALEPVFELKTYARIGNRISRRVLRVDTEEPLSVAEIQNLSRSDIEKIDCATIARGLDRLRSETTADNLTLIIPVSFVSLSSRHGRATLAGLFEEAKAFVRTGVICEVCDIEGVPQAAMLEATSLIKPYCLFAIGRLAAAPERKMVSLAPAGLQAVSFEAPQGLDGETEFFNWAKPAVETAKRSARSVIVYQLDSARRAGVVSLLGASHASLRSGLPA